MARRTVQNPQTYNLTCSVVGITGQPVPNVGIAIDLVDKELSIVGMTPETRTLLPDGVARPTDTNGEIVIPLLPSSVVGDYVISIGAFSRTITMPDADIRLSQI